MECLYSVRLLDRNRKFSLFLKSIRFDVRFLLFKGFTLIADSSLRVNYITDCYKELQNGSVPSSSMEGKGTGRDILQTVETRTLSARYTT